MIQIDHLTFRQLRALDAVARERAINRAAELLSLTPPAVHNQLKTLEEAVGAPLFDRQSSDGFTLTESGEVLLAAYREGHTALTRACRHIDAMSDGLAGHVTLGVVSTAKYFAPGIVARLRDDLPDIQLRLEIGNRSEIIADLAERHFDLCIMGRPPRRPQVNAVALGDHPHLIVAKPSHPLVGMKKVDVEDLLAQTFVMREMGSGTRILGTRYLDELGNGREVRMFEMASNETIKQAVISGLGIAMLSGHTIVEELKTGRLVPLNSPEMPIMRQWFLVTRRDQELSRTARRVHDWIVAEREDLLPKLPPLFSEPQA